ncbi:MAG: hypothetical protein PHF34_02110 [Bacteroidales bacterium]|nr:hypothetical protein [Bacteroidales bacterium]
MKYYRWYLLTPDIFQILEDTKPGRKGEIQLTDALRRYNSSLGLVAKNTRYDIGDISGWMVSNLQLLLKHPIYGDMIRDALREK